MMIVGEGRTRQKPGVGGLPLYEGTGCPCNSKTTQFSHYQPAMEFCSLPPATCSQTQHTNEGSNMLLARQDGVKQGPPKMQHELQQRSNPPHQQPVYNSLIQLRFCFNPTDCEPLTLFLLLLQHRAVAALPAPSEKKAERLLDHNMRYSGLAPP